MTSNNVATGTSHQFLQAQTTITSSSSSFSSTILLVNPSSLQVCYDPSHITPKCLLLARDSLLQLATIYSSYISRSPAKDHPRTEVHHKISSENDKFNDVDVLLSIRSQAYRRHKKYCAYTEKLSQERNRMSDFDNRARRAPVPDVTSSLLPVHANTENIQDGGAADTYHSPWRNSLLLPAIVQIIERQ